MIQERYLNFRMPEFKHLWSFCVILHLPNYALYVHLVPLCWSIMCAWSWLDYAVSHEITGMDDI